MRGSVCSWLYIANEVSVYSCARGAGDYWGPDGRNK
jgi:hypothetical protein